MARAGGPLAAAAAGLRGAAMAVSGAAVVGMMALVTFEVLLRRVGLAISLLIVAIATLLTIMPGILGPAT
jgi:hypothetical protein